MSLRPWLDASLGHYKVMGEPLREGPSGRKLGLGVYPGRGYWYNSLFLFPSLSGSELLPCQQPYSTQSLSKVLPYPRPSVMGPTSKQIN